VVPGSRTIEQEIEEAKILAIRRCVAAGGSKKTIEVVEVEIVPVSYVTNGATRLVVRAVGDLARGFEKSHDQEQFLHGETVQKPGMISTIANSSFKGTMKESKGSSYDIIKYINPESYRPRIEGDIWYLSELDLGFLLDGAGVLGVGSCGEPYPSYLACLLALRNGEELKIMRQDTVADDAVILVAGFMV
jgi:hypothetical protein